jgi:hypothetical protein
VVPPEPHKRAYRKIIHHLKKKVFIIQRFLNTNNYETG